MDYLKILFYGAISSLFFFLFVRYFGSWIGMLIFNSGDAFEVSYHMFTRMGLITLSGIIIICTIIIVQKLNELNELLKKQE